jgi:hypothetical protein
MNPYAYVRWNPVMFTDPTGMEVQVGTLWGTAVGFSSFGYDGRNDGSRKFGPYAAAFSLGGAAAVNAMFYGGSVGGTTGFVFSSGEFGNSFSYGAARFGGGGIGLGVLGTVAVGLGAPIALAAALASLPEALVGGSVGALGGAIVGGINTGSLEGALAGAATGAAAGAVIASLPITGVGMIGTAVFTGFSSAAVTAIAQVSSTGSVNWGQVGTSFALGVTAGFFAVAATVAGGTLAGAYTGMLADVGFTAMSAVAGTTADPSTGGGAAAVPAPAQSPTGVGFHGTMYVVPDPTHPGWTTLVPGP